MTYFLLFRVEEHELPRSSRTPGGVDPPTSASASTPRSEDARLLEHPGDLTDEVDGVGAEFSGGVVADGEGEIEDGIISQKHQVNNKQNMCSLSLSHL